MRKCALIRHFILRHFVKKEGPAMLTISDDAFNLIVTEEDGSEAYYTRHYQHFEWPAGASGPTIGIGYDCGYVSVQEAKADWTGIVDDATIQHIVAACGKQGRNAHAWVAAHGGSVTITWDQAIKEFRDRELPKWIQRVQGALLNCDKLSPTSFGALVSLAYNRGASFGAPGARFAEMRAIKQHMSTENFSTIPHDILSMRRLWPQGGDLWRRREHEAVLFQKGLAHATTA
jgi:GH24 family phage-related lysozyme (muramidase)